MGGGKARAQRPLAPGLVVGWWLGEPPVGPGLLLFFPISPILLSAARLSTVPVSALAQYSLSALSTLEETRSQASLVSALFSVRALLDCRYHHSQTTIIDPPAFPFLA